MSIGATYGAQEMFASTTHNTNVQPTIRALYVSVGGNLAIEDFAGHAITIAVDKGMILPIIGVWKIKTTGTTATVFGMR
jgi:hypothetical protein